MKFMPLTPFLEGRSNLIANSRPRTLKSGRAVLADRSATLLVPSFVYRVAPQVKQEETMIRQRSSSARQTALLLLCLAGATACSAQAPAGDTVYHLHGTVIDGVTGKPLSRALVKSGDQRLATMTGPDGKFAIDIRVPERPDAAGNPSRNSFAGIFPGLTAQKPGYLLPQGRQTAIALSDTLSSTSVDFKLMPAAVITGRVSSAVSDSAAGFRVNLLLHQVMEGHFLWVPAGTVLTNARGDFRFPDLRPGEYALATAQWAGDQAQAMQGGAITQQYPPTFYGDVRSLAGSTKLRVHYGDVARTEIHLHLTTYYPITVPVTPLSDNIGVTTRLTGMGYTGSSPLRYSREKSAVEGSLPSGDYTLLLATAGGGPQQSYATLPIHVESSPVRTGDITLTPPATIQVRVHTEFTKQDDSSTFNTQLSGVLRGSGSSRTQPQLVQLLLRSEDGSGGYVAVSHPSPGGDLVIDNVQPGHYLVHEQPFRGYVASITSSGVDLLEHPLIVNPSGAPDPIDVTLRDDTATLNGSVKPGDGPPPQNSFIALLPTGSSGHFSQALAGPDGKFSAENVAPGTYLVLAFRGQAFQLPYREAEAMRHYDGKGPTVTVAAGESPQIDVPLLDEAEEQ